ncbi:cellulose binding domain-containing protein [Herbidospora cretacea]|uniref:cellulose binding domain-containing protein n=1 Tax=Herbidospora cretacea TaxID=28444 RepID=UPI0009E00E77|nr:cellulose binding domain-containing protein [Herbidospora cretacea]
MAERRVRRRRRLTVWLVAALVGAFTVVTPADAATTCTLAFKANYLGDVGTQYRWQVDATLTNTGTTTSTTWEAVINFPLSAGAVVHRFWNATRPSTNVWRPAGWNGALPKNRQAYFGFEIGMPMPNTSPPLPTSSSCTITY